MQRVVWVLVVLLAASSAHADGDDTLSIGVTGFGSWPQAVASLQGDTTSEGRVLRVTVHDRDGGPVDCGTYTLSLDAVGAQAFEIGRCDASTHETLVRLVHRSALFAHDDIVPRPLAAGVSAVLVHTGGASGGAGGVGGSELECSVAVRPYLTDREHGTRVYLTPGRFVLRSPAATVRVTAGASDWTLHGSVEGGLTVEYEVFDTLRSTVVVHDRATLQCRSEAVASEPTGALIVQTDPRTATVVQPLQLVVPPMVPLLAPPRPNPIASVYGSIEIGSVGYLPLAGLPLSNGGNRVHGSDLGVADTWLVGTGGIGVVAEFPYSLLAVRAHFAFSDHMVMLEARATAAAGARIGGAFWYAGATASAWQGWLEGVGPRAWDTGMQTSVGLEAGVRIHTTTRWMPARDRFRLGETAFSLGIPIVGNGAFMFTWEGAWGTGR